MNSALGKNITKVLNSPLISVLLALSVTINFLLARDLSKLRNVVDAMKSENSLRVGTMVPPIDGYSVKGEKQSLTFNYDMPTVVYVFTPQCSWCRKNLNNLHSLIDNSGANYRIVGVSLSADDVEKYLEAEHLAFPVYTHISQAIQLAYHLGGTPTTIVVSPQSKVLKVWYGAYEGAIKEEIENYLKVQLKDCCATKAAN